MSDEAAPRRAPSAPDDDDTAHDENRNHIHLEADVPLANGIPLTDDMAHVVDIPYVDGFVPNNDTNHHNEPPRPNGILHGDDMAQENDISGEEAENDILHEGEEEADAIQQHDFQYEGVVRLGPTIRRINIRQQIVAESNPSSANLPDGDEPPPEYDPTPPNGPQLRNAEHVHYVRGHEQARRNGQNQRDEQRSVRLPTSTVYSFHFCFYFREPNNHNFHHREGADAEHRFPGFILGVNRHEYPEAGSRALERVYVTFCMSWWLFALVLMMFVLWRLIGDIVGETGSGCWRG